MKVNQVRFGVITLLCALIVCLTMSMVGGCPNEIGPKGTITLYTSVPAAIIEELKEEFEAQNPGLHLEIYWQDTGAIVDKINQEIAAGQVQGDFTMDGPAERGKDDEEVINASISSADG